MTAAEVVPGDGTPLAAWESDALLAAAPLLTPPRGRVVVVAPHPDDEVLGAGGLMRQAADAGAEVAVAAVTDGEASHPGSPTLTATDLAATRALEAARALEALGLAGVTRWRLGFPDGAVAGHERALTERLRDLLRPGTTCVAPVVPDGHPDHDASGRAAAAAAEEAGAALLRFPVWTWHWATPGDARVLWSAARRLPLPPAVWAAKQRAAREFRTQVEPLSPHPADQAILPAPVLARLLRPVEVFFA